MPSGIIRPNNPVTRATKPLKIVGPMAAPKSEIHKEAARHESLL